MSSDQQPANNQHSADNNQQQPSPSAAGPVGWIEHHYKRLKENAETYPYVWASYAVVYVGFGLWTTYRWRKLRRTEDRVRVLQARLHELVEAEESATLKAVPDRTTSTAVPEMTASNTITKAEESAAAGTVTDKAAI
ncbi:ATP synthase gamma chain like [Heracleum sosnowskyi]|uniref:ATP synthase gamma chain like n=1 Tax=Heracleum sosnowskyi TaxID=360622 RepID=A0AAD8M613_9APIA|nr:ATP synthase gamma chain like [Heracleum sosnowskyi]